MSRASGPSVTAPADLPSAAGTFIRAEISAIGGPVCWTEPAHAYFRRDAAGWTLVGFERLPGGNPPGLSGRKPEAFLTSFGGYLQADAYAGFDSQYRWVGSSKCGALRMPDAGLSRRSTLTQRR